MKRNDHRGGLHNGDRAVVSAIDVQTSEVELDCGGRRVNVGPDFLYARTAHGDPTLVHGYAVTGHIAQGLTVDRAFVLADPGSPASGDTPPSHAVARPSTCTSAPSKTSSAVSTRRPSRRRRAPSRSRRSPAP